MTKLKINNETSNIIVLCMFFFYPSVQEFIWKILSILTGPLGFELSRAVINSTIWALAVLPWMVHNVKKFSKVNIIIYLCFNITAMFSLIYTKAIGISTERVLLLLFASIPAFFFGSYIEVNESTLSKLFPFAIFSFAITTAYVLYQYLSGTGLPEGSSDMASAYIFLPITLIITEHAYNSSKHFLFKSTLSVLSFVLLLSYNNRGSLLCALFILVLILIDWIGLKKFSIAAVIVAVPIVVVLSSERIMELIITVLSAILGEGSRIVNLASNGGLFGGSGRSGVYAKIIEEFLKAPFAVRGLFADYAATSLLGSWSIEGGSAHNFCLALLIDFGCIVGGAMIIFILYKTVRMLSHPNRDLRWVARVFTCLVLVKLSLSSTITEEKNFFFLIGLMVNPMFSYPVKWRKGSNETL